MIREIAMRNIAKFTVRASQPQHTPAGRIVERMYYRCGKGGVYFLDVLRSHADQDGQAEYSGYPHNGGEHSLTLRMGEEDIRAFLDLVRETVRDDDGGVTEFIRSCEDDFRRRYGHDLPCFH